MSNDVKGKVKGSKVLAIGLLCLAIASPLALCGCGSSKYKSSSSSKYTEKELEDAHKLYEEREKIINENK